MSTGLGLGLVALIVALNGFFVLSEYALVASRRSVLALLAGEGKRSAKAALRLKETPLHFIGTAQLGVTVASIVLGAVGEPLFARFIDPWLASGLALILGLIVLTYLHVVLGELAPKAVALATPERVALWCAWPLTAVFRLTWPLVFVLQRSAAAVSWLLGVRQGVGEHQVSEDELRLLLGEAGEGGAIEEAEEEMALKVLDLGDKRAHDVMIPRPDVCVLNGATTVSQALAAPPTSRHVLYPVVGEDADDLLGVVDLRQLTAAAARGEGATTLAALARPAHMVPETKGLLELLSEFLGGRAEMALVLDEYGQLTGVVTLMDLFEEIVGEVADARLRAREPRRVGDRLLVSGQFEIDEFNERYGEELGAALPGDDYRTLSGFVFGALGRAPVVGDRVEHEGVALTVRTVDGTRIEQLEIATAAAG